MSHTSTSTETNAAEGFATARDELRGAELDLVLQREQVAEMRRALPPGPIVEDYVFDVVPAPESSAGSVRLTELFTAPDRTLILYHFMLGKEQDEACPMCSMWADGWAAVADHVGSRVDFAMVSGGPVADLAALAAARGWTDLRLLGASDSTFKVDIGGEDEHGNQSPFISVYRLDAGRPRLRYSGSAHITGDQWRGIDLLSPVWHLLDLTPEGRGDWMPTL